MPVNNMQADPQMEQSGGGGGMDVVKNLDDMLGAIAESFSTRPELNEVAKKMNVLRSEYRKLIDEAKTVASGGPKMPGMVPKGMPVMDMQQGTPQSPAGNY
jgi:hypothetical protein